MTHLGSVGIPWLEREDAQRRLRNLLVLDAIVSYGGAAFALMVYIAAFRDANLLVLAGVALSTAAQLTLGARRAGVGRIDSALVLFAAGNWTAALGVALVGTFAWPLMLLAAVLPAIVVAPHAQPRSTRLYVVGSLAVAVGVTLLGNVQDVTGFSDAAPGWAKQSVVAFFAPFLSALVVLTAWQNSSRLRRALNAEVEVNRQLSESRRRLVAATDRERRRIERDLHDGAQQRLVALSMLVRRVRDTAGPDHTPMVPLLDELQAGVRAAQAELAALVQGVYPPVLEQHGLSAALHAAAQRSGLDVQLDVERVVRTPSAIEAAVYFCCVEALQNISKHAGDEARVVVGLTRTDDEIAFRVVDDGRGFDQQTAVAGHGFDNMRDRIEAAGGWLEVDAALGAGVSVRGRVPLHPRWAD